MAETGKPLSDERPEADRRALRDEDDGYLLDEAERRGERHSTDQRWWASLGASRFLLVIAGAGLGIVLLIVGVSGGGWVFLVLAVLALLASIAAVVAMVLQATTEVEKPSAEEVADLEAQGVRDPERALNEEVAAEPEGEQGEPDDRAALDERAEDEDPVERTSEQKGKITPSSSSSRPVGPDGD